MSNVSSIPGASRILPDIYNKKGELTHLWWECVPEDVPRMIWATVLWLWERQTGRRAACLHHLRVYSNRLATNLSGSAYEQGRDSGDRIRMNVTKSAIDAALAQIATNTPGIMHLVDGGTYGQRKQGERLDRYDRGWFERVQLAQQFLGVFLDACIDGHGLLKWTIGQGVKGQTVINAERVRSDSIIVDDNEARIHVPGVAPRFMFELRSVPRSVLTGNPAYQKYWKEIVQAEYLDVWHPIYQPVEATCTMIEAWKLPAFGKPGRHTITLSNLTLLDEEWTSPRFPFSEFRWNLSPIGYHGIGAVEEILPLQIELNFTLQKIQTHLHLAASTIFKKRGPPMGKFTNDPWNVYEYDDVPPTFATPTPIHPQYFEHVDKLKQAAYEIMGVSQMSATGTKPQGLYSGEAIRMYHDVATRRFQHTGKMMEQFFIDAAEQVEERSREAVERGWATPQTLGFGDHEVGLIKWSEAEIDRNMYAIRARPVSIIPQEPSGKIELLKTLAPLYPQLLPYLIGALSGIPDLEHIVRRVDAPLRYAEKLVGNVMEKGAAGYEPISIDGSDMETAQAVYDVAKRELLVSDEYGLPAEHIEMLRQLRDEAKGLVDAMTPVMQQGPGGGGAADSTALQAQSPQQPQFPGAPPMPQGAPFPQQ